MKAEQELMEAFNAFFSKAKMDGIKAIAHSTSETSRMELLGLMEYIDNHEAKFKALLKTITTNTVVFIGEEEDITDDMVAQMPQEFSVEKIKKGNGTNN